MDFMDSLRRGVDKAGFEVDRLLRVNRVRSRINSLRSQIDEEERRIGRRIAELYAQGGLVQEDVREQCDRIALLQKDVAQAESELDAINKEMPADSSPRPAAEVESEQAFCSTCGAGLPEGARFCSRCGAEVAIRMPAAGQPAGPEPKPKASLSDQAPNLDDATS